MCSRIDTVLCCMQMNDNFSGKNKQTKETWRTMQNQQNETSEDTFVIGIAE